VSGKELGLVAFLVLNLSVALCLSSCRAGRDQVEREAVAAGVAEWVPDAGGRPVFQWKVPPGGSK
jgi:hypothetical protein